MRRTRTRHTVFRPGKRRYDIESALNISTIIADSAEEVSLIQNIAAARGEIVEIGLRLNPNFTFFSDNGVPSKFGIDIDKALQLLTTWKKYSNIKIVGIHVHSRSQELNASVLERYYEKMFHLACSFQGALGSRLYFINMGSGLGIPYSQNHEDLDTRR